MASSKNWTQIMTPDLYENELQKMGLKEKEESKRNINSIPKNIELLEKKPPKILISNNICFF